MDKKYDFDRFVAAQNAVYATVLAELAAGRKDTAVKSSCFCKLGSF